MLKSSSTSSFLKLAPQESVMDEWELLDDSAAIHISDILVLVVWLAVVYFGLMLFLRVIPPRDIVDFRIVRGVRAVLLLAPCAYVAWKVASRPKRKGYICLTNWRCIYFERAEGWVRNRFHVFASDLDDVVGIHTVYEQNVFGTKSLLLIVLSKSEDHLILRIGNTGGLLSKLPGIGHLFRRSSLGKDAFWAPPVLYHRIQDRKAAFAAPSPSY